ncbi:MAG: GMC family oxidoreductase [Myxococcales bacterium]|nr:GMC family oxidoreductase [Myxococcales bacterium]
MEQYDAVIIGSGYGGSIPAARLAEAGMSVLVLERGPRYAAADFEQSDDPRYIQRIVDLVLSKTNVAFRTGKMVGGASIPMDGAHFRMPQRSFEVVDGLGRRYWPDVYSRAMLDPYYERAEQMLSVRQLGWTEISKAGGLFAKMLDTVGASAERARLNYTDCRQCGFCAQGCIYGKKQSLLYNYIPLAESHGAEFRAGCLVDHLEPVKGGYLVYYERFGVARHAFARRVFVAGGGIHTPALLLRSQNWLPALSSHVGEHFNNNGEHAFLGILPPEFDELSSYLCWKGMDNAGVMSFHWFDSHDFTLHPGGGIEPTVFAADFAAPDDAVLPSRAWGMPYKRFVETVYPHRIIAFSALGLAEGHRAVAIDAAGAPDMVERDRSAYDAYLDRIEVVMADLEAQTGVRLLPTVPRPLAGTTSAHLLCSCRMAESAADGVVDPDGQVFGYENLYVCDASALSFALGVNPALTISAIAERTAELAIAKG